MGGWGGGPVVPTCLTLLALLALRPRQWPTSTPGPPARLPACLPACLLQHAFSAAQPSPPSCLPTSLQAPNPDDPLNKEAAQMMQQSPAQFERTVAQSITRGCSIGGEYFPPARGERSSG